jgi:hypothetical protein
VSLSTPEKPAIKIGILVAGLAWFLAAPLLVADGPPSAWDAADEDPPSDSDILRAMPRFCVCGCWVVDLVLGKA